ncbi:MAG: class II fructose-bisphosphate aldolase [Thermomicrobiales bacterium]|nr:class II fructose-bisphosphate aldolase [Thermomicrobiales bacterium]
MALAPTIDLLRAARIGGYGIPAFNVIGLEHAEAIVRGAEAERAPVILQVSENAVKYHGGAIEPIAAACRALAEAASVPVALHLDHATSRALCERAVAAGFGSVMLDESALPLADNERQVADLVRWAHARGVAVEGMLGMVGGKEGMRDTAEERTDPVEAAAYVARTGVDALAVAVGTTHGMVERTARIDLGLVSALRAAVPVPLVLHGSSGVSDADLAAAVRHGMTKINLATQLNQAFTATIRACLEANPAQVDPRRYLAPARDAVEAVVRDRLRLLGGAGRG